MGEVAPRPLMDGCRDDRGRQSWQRHLALALAERVAESDFRARQVVLILDNCEYVLADCSTYADTMLRHCAHLQIVATSRQPLPVAGELLMRVPPLAAPADESLEPPEVWRDATVELFVGRALQARVPTAAMSPLLVRTHPARVVWQIRMSRRSGLPS